MTIVVGMYVYVFHTQCIHMFLCIPYILQKGIASRLKGAVNEAKFLLDFYYSIGSLVHIKVMGIWILQHML